jgi:hypothetical protein
VIDVRPIDGLGFDMYRDMEEDPAANAHLMWQIAARCLPSMKLEEVKAFTPQECMAVVAVAAGRVALVEELAREMEGNGEASTVGTPARTPTITDPTGLVIVSVWRERGGELRDVVLATIPRNLIRATFTSAS